MIFPSDTEIREYSEYYIRAIKIFKEIFKYEMGREPSESEIQDFSKMGIIPFGIVKQQNGNPNFQNPQVATKELIQQAQKLSQQSVQKSKIEPIMDIVKKHPELSIEGEKIVMKKKIEPVDVFYEVRDELEKRGWKYVKPKNTGGDKWEPGYFEFKEGAKA